MFYFPPSLRIQGLAYARSSGRDSHIMTIKMHQRPAALTPGEYTFHLAHACDQNESQPCSPTADPDRVFPHTVVSKILWLLEGKDFGRAICLSKRWRDVGNSESRHWQRLCMHAYPLYAHVPANQDWRELYLHERDTRFGVVHPVRLDFQATHIKLHASKAAASYQNVITLWDLDTCTQISRISTECEIACIEVDNDWVAAGLENDEVRIWEHSSQVPIHCFNTMKKKSRGTFACVGFNKCIIAAGGLEGICVWSIETGDCMHSIQLSRVFCLELVHRTLLLGAFHCLRAWDLDSQVTKSTICSGMLTCIKYWPGLDKIGVGMCGRWQDTGMAGIYDAAMGRWHEDCKYYEGDGAGVLALDRDATKLVTGGLDQVIKVWDLETQECVRMIDGLAGDYITAIQIRGNRIVCGSNRGISVLKFNA